MKIIIMEQTIPFLCKSQEEYNALIKEGYILKQFKELKYLIKEELIK